MQVIDCKHSIDLVRIDIGVFLQGLLDDLLVDIVKYLIQKVTALRNVIDAFGTLNFKHPPFVFTDSNFNSRLVAFVHLFLR